MASEVDGKQAGPQLGKAKERRHSKLTRPLPLTIGVGGKVGDVGQESPTSLYEPTAMASYTSSANPANREVGRTKWGVITHFVASE